MSITRINHKLVEKLNTTEREYKKVKGRRDELKQENIELEGNMNKTEDKRRGSAAVLNIDYR